MNYSEFYTYDHVVEKLQNSPNLKKYQEMYNLSQDSPFTYAAFLATQGTTKTRNTTSDLNKKERELRSSNPSETLNASEHCTYMSAILLKHIFSDISFFGEALEKYNIQFTDFNRYCKNRDNPYNLNLDQLYGQLLNKNLETPKGNLEHYLQIMTLSNKATKILKMFNDYHTEQAVNSAKKINERNKLSGRKNIYSTSKKDYASTFTNISNLLDKMSTPEYPIKLDFLKTYTQYIHKKISLDELKQSQSYIDVNDLFRQNNPKNCYITPENFFTNLSLNHSKSNLYLQKSHYFKKSVKEFKRLSKTKDAKNYRLTKYTDPSIPALSGTTYNTSINFAVKGYNAPYSIHESEDNVSDLENKLGITIEEGNIPRPYVVPIPYKYNSIQQETISDINRIIFERGANRKLTDISNFSQNMIASPDSLEKDGVAPKRHYRKIVSAPNTPDEYDYR